MKKTLPSIRIEESTESKMQRAISKLNEKSLIKIQMQHYRRLSYEVFSKMVLEGKEIPVDLE